MLAGASEAREIGKVLNHPVRRRIIELLGSRGPLSWKELSGELGVATGALYYHLDTLEGVIARSAGRKYALTRQGGQMFESLQSNPSSSPQEIASAMSTKGGAAAILLSVFAPRSVLQRLGSSGSRALVASAVISALLLLDMAYGGFSVRLYYFAGSPFAVALEWYVASFAATVAVSYAASALVLRAKPSLGQLAVGCVLSFAPVAVLATAVVLVPQLGTLRPLSTVLLVFFQAWSAAVLAAGISLASGVRLEKTLVVGLAILYATLATILL